MCYEQLEDGLAPGPLSNLKDSWTAFPSELHDYTINLLHNDRASLRACSLVCKSWTASSQYHLFKNVTIHIRAGNFSQFCGLLASTRLSLYFVRLDLERPPTIYEFERDAQIEESAQFEAQLYRFKPLLNLKYLRLIYDNCDVGPSFSSAIGSNFSSVTDLELTDIFFTSFADIIRSCVGLPHLRRLALLSADWYEDQDEDASAPDLPMLDTFAIDNGQRLQVVLRWLPSQLRIRRIAIARLILEDVLLFDNVLRTLGPRLEHLIFDVISNHNAIMPDLSHATALRALEIRGRYWNFDPFYLSALLERLPSRVCALQRIVFILDDLDPARDPHFLDSSRLAPILSSLDSLEQVDFYVSYEQWASEIIHERLAPRRYALRVQGSVDQPQGCSLSRFDC